MRYHLVRTQQVPVTRASVTDFFEQPENLQELTPPFLHFQIETPLPITMKEGARIDYTIRLHGLALRWRTHIEAYVPGRRFVDVQLKGPYALWRHTHTFLEIEGGTEIRDHVEYELPFGPIGALGHRALVRRQLETIFDFRAKVVADRFGPPPAPPGASQTSAPGVQPGLGSSAVT